jgi:hypothetical protein
VSDGCADAADRVLQGQQASRCKGNLSEKMNRLRTEEAQRHRMRPDFISRETTSRYHSEFTEPTEFNDGPESDGSSSTSFVAARMMSKKMMTSVHKTPIQWCQTMMSWTKERRSRYACCRRWLL